MGSVVSTFVDLASWLKGRVSSQEKTIKGKDSYQWLFAGSDMEKSGHYKEAIECYDKVLEINPRSSIAWSHKGDVLRRLGKYSEAISCYDEALRIKPSESTRRKRQVAEEQLKGRRPGREAESGVGREKRTVPHYYEILGVAPTASQQEIRRAYRNMMKQCHPDRFASQPSSVQKEALQKSKRINEAYEQLRDARRRRRYDSKVGL